MFDRQTGTFTEQLNASATFRSASVVILLLALDFLWNRSPAGIPDADRARLDAMLRSSRTAPPTTTGRPTAGPRSPTA
ncbi:hypothetical protein [Streptomyces althioticus]|uniref:hypothetical protein n=1 Tax=Streptomyces althioticus TaxID=83380 RepID=UPI003793ADC9